MSLSLPGNLPFSKKKSTSGSSAFLPLNINAYLTIMGGKINSIERLSTEGSVKNRERKVHGTKWVAQGQWRGKNSDFGWNFYRLFHYYYCILGSCCELPEKKRNSKCNTFSFFFLVRLQLFFCVALNTINYVNRICILTALK